MADPQGILTTQGGFLTQTFRESGLRGCVRKMTAAAKMYLPRLLLRRRTNQSVGAYFDLITDDARLFYDDNFHFGIFADGAATLQAGLDAHTDLVASMARLRDGDHVLDLGCGIGAPAIRMAKQHQVRMTGVNISREQIRQGNALVAAAGMQDRVSLQYGNALALPFADQTFDAVCCLEVAGDICVTAAQKSQLMAEIWRVVKPGGHVGFSDLIFTGVPTDAEESVMETLLYHKGRELVTNWPALFTQVGFQVLEQQDVINHTHATWDHTLAIYERDTAAVETRYGKTVARRTMDALRQIPAIMQQYGGFIVLSAQKPR